MKLFFCNSFLAPIHGVCPKHHQSKISDNFSATKISERSEKSDKSFWGCLLWLVSIVDQQLNRSWQLVYLIHHSSLNCHDSSTSSPSLDLRVDELIDVWYWWKNLALLMTPELAASKEVEDDMLKISNICIKDSTKLIMQALIGIRQKTPLYVFTQKLGSSKGFYFGIYFSINCQS